MKIIGQTEDGYIVEVAKHELAQAAGYYSIGEMVREERVRIGWSFVCELVFVR